jgi:hypothetical protein
MKTTLIIAAVLFLLTCLFPPWQYTADINGSDGFHSHRPAGYAIIFSPPQPQGDNYMGRQYGFGVSMDFSRLLMEWAILGVATGMVLFLRQGQAKPGSETKRNG